MVKNSRTLLKKMRFLKSKKPKVGLALGSGSARGLAHIGVLKVLKTEGIPIDVVTGTSIGALIGSIYAAGREVKTLEKLVLNTDWKKTVALFLPTLSKSGLVNGRKVEALLKTFVGNKKFEELQCPFAAVATDIESGEEIVIAQGDLIRAIRASISLPGIFTPVRYGDRFLVDGGMVDPIPADVARRMGADIVIAVNVIPDVEKKVKAVRIRKISSQKSKERKAKGFLKAIRGGGAPNIFQVLLRTINIMECEIAKARLKEADIIIEPDIERIRLIDFYRGKEAISAGEKATQGALPQIKRLIKRR